MAETENYYLYLTDSASEKFIEWREKMNGTKDSNMIKIDRALHSKADSSTSFFSVLSSSAWEGNEAPFTQEIDVPGLGSEQNGSISIRKGATKSQISAVISAELSVDEQRENTLVISAYGKLPECDIPVEIILLG